MGGRHCAAVEPRPGSRAASTQAVAPSVVGGGPRETMRIGHGAEREKDDAGRDNAVHARSSGAVAAATPSRCLAGNAGMDGTFQGPMRAEATACSSAKTWGY